MTPPRRGTSPPAARGRAGTPAGPRRPAAAKPPGEVRLIGGLWKRSKLPVPDRPGLRPTPDRVRETLFNWLGQDLTGWRVLDAFAGSGALGLEAASRGAAEVQMIERDAAIARSLIASRERLGAAAVQVRCTDALAWMSRAAPGAFDLVLLDPPFDAGLLEPALVHAAPLVAADGLLYVEAGEPLAALPAGFELCKQLRAGAVFAHLLRRAD
ncbi:MAG: 16S rRNA (guanine(966)-N(2))-methyltransferase RsmD [Burkholderiales bacterium]|nr:16S rRNA (guanine(966)-N(2))-methyltransferase RsmD [Burkholderiales bacterium]